MTETGDVTLPILPEAVKAPTVEPVSLRQALLDFGNALDSLDEAIGLSVTADEIEGAARIEAARTRKVLEAKLA